MRLEGFPTKYLQWSWLVAAGIVPGARNGFLKMQLKKIFLSKSRAFKLLVDITSFKGPVQFSC